MAIFGRGVCGGDSALALSEAVVGCPKHVRYYPLQRDPPCSSTALMCGRAVLGDNAWIKCLFEDRFILFELLENCA